MDESYEGAVPLRQRPTTGSTTSPAPAAQRGSCRPVLRDLAKDDTVTEDQVACLVDPDAVRVEPA